MRNFCLAPIRKHVFGNICFVELLFRLFLFYSACLPMYWGLFCLSMQSCWRFYTLTHGNCLRFYFCDLRKDVFVRFSWYEFGRSLLRSAPFTFLFSSCYMTFRDSSKMQLFFCSVEKQWANFRCACEIFSSSFKVLKTEFRLLIYFTVGLQSSLKIKLLN